MIRISAVALVVSLLGNPARAEEAGSSAESDQIVVYGEADAVSVTGLPLSLRETPQSISVVTREQIDDQAFARISDVLAYTTGVSIKAVDRGRNQLSARGFEITNFQLDGIPFATGNIGFDENNTALYERIEVVRGATGLLNGAGEPSAAVNLVRKHADNRVFTGFVGVELGSWDRRAGTVDLTVPLDRDGAVRARLVAQAYEQDGFIDLEHSKGTVVYGVIDADLGENTRISIGASNQRDERSGVAWAQLPYWYSDGTRTRWKRSMTTAARWNQWNTTDQSAFLTIEQRLGDDWSLRGDASYHRQVENSKLLWFSGTPDRVTGLDMAAEPFWYLSKPEQWHVSAMAKGGFTLFGRRHELVLGAMYSRLKNGWTNRDPVSPLAEVGDFNSWDGSFPEPEWGERYIMSGWGNTVQSAVYGVTRLHLTEGLTLIAGGRLSNWKREEKEALYTPAPYTMRHKGVFTPYAGLVLDITKALSAYASFTRIFNPQDYRDRAGRYLEPLEGTNYEGGLKASLLNDRLRASAAVFRVKQDNFPVLDDGYLVPGTIEPAYRPGQGVVAKGYELEAVGEIGPGWDISLGWTHYSAKDDAGEPVQTHHPRKLLNLTSKYAFQSALEGLSVGGALKWESRPPKRDVNPATGVEEPVGQPAHVLVDLMARYAFNPNWALQLNVDNVFDKTYYTNNGWFSGFIYGEPRNARLTLKYSF